MCDFKIHDCHNDNTIFNTKKWIEYTDEVKQALEKQIAKKPKEISYIALKHFGWDYECPTCKCAVGQNNNALDYTDYDKFCPSCGQKLEW